MMVPTNTAILMQKEITQLECNNNPTKLFYFNRDKECEKNETFPYKILGKHASNKSRKWIIKDMIKKGYLPVGYKDLLIDGYTY